MRTWRALARNSGRLRDDRVVAAASALDDLANRLSLPVHLLAFETERDARYHDLVAGHMAGPVTTSTATVDTVFDEVARSRLVVGMRVSPLRKARALPKTGLTIILSPPPHPSLILRRISSSSKGRGLKTVLT